MAPAVIRGLVFGLVLVAAPPAAAEEPTPLRWSSHEAIPAWISDLSVAAQTTRAVVEAWQQPDRKRALGCVALRNGLTLATTELLKRLVRRQRPDRSDALSFPSGHSAMATVNAARGWSASLTVGATWGRQAAGKHYATDVAAGVGIGLLAQKVCTP